MQIGVLENALNRLGETALHLGIKGSSPQFKTAFVHAFPFLEAMGDVIIAWMLLWRASVATEKLNNGAKKKDVGFYQGQVQTAKFFINTILPVTLGQMTAIQDFDGSVMDIEDGEFGGL